MKGRFQNTKNEQAKGVAGGMPNTLMLLAVCFLSSTLLFASLPSASAYARGDNTIAVKVVADGGAVDGASIMIEGPAGFCSDGRSDTSTAAGRFAGLAAGEYRVAVSLPLGYALDSIQVGMGAAQPVADNRSQATVHLTSQQEVSVAFTCHRVKDLGFKASDQTVNRLSTLPLCEVKTEMKAAPLSLAGPFDIVVVFDYSLSMSRDFHDVAFDPDEAKADYMAKHNENSRYRALEDAARSFLTELQKNATGNIGFVFYESNAYIADFPTGAFTSIEDLNVDSFVEDVMRGYVVRGGTRTDLALEAAKRMLASLPAPGSGAVPHERKVVFFTDGEPSEAGLQWMSDPTSDYRPWDYYAQEYCWNAYRVMAETYNQSDIIKADYGIEKTVNNAVEGKSPYFDYRPHYNDDFPIYTYYGAPIKPGSIGISQDYTSAEVPDGYFSGEFSNLYNQAEYSGALAALWKDVANWKKEHYDDLDYLYNDLLYYQFAVDNKGSNPFPVNYASNKHGNYLRTDIGQGAQIYSVAIIANEDEITTPPERERYNVSVEFLTRTAGSKDRVFLSSDKEALNQAFQQVFDEMAGTYEQAYLRFNVDADWSIYTAEGAVVDADMAKGIWLEDEYLWVGPFTVSSDSDPLEFARFLIYSRSITNAVGRYERAEAGPQPDMIVRASMFQKNSGGVFVKLESDQLWAQAVTISEY